MFSTTLGNRCLQCIVGPVLAHEHLVIDLRTNQDPDAFLDHDAAVTDELLNARRNFKLGLVVDVTTSGMGASPYRVTQISRNASVPVAIAVGFYLPQFRETTLRSVNHGRELLEAQMTPDDTATPAVVGEVGVTTELTLMDRWAVQSCLLVAAAWNRPVVLHSHLAKANAACREMLDAAGVDPELVCVAHQDLNSGLGPILEMLELGTYVAFDTIGKNAYSSDDQRLALMRDLVERGWGHRIMISNDVSRHAYLASSGGGGYAGCLGPFTTALHTVLPAETVDRLTRENALRWLDVSTDPCAGCRGRDAS